MKGYSNLSPASLWGRIILLCLKIAYRLMCWCVKTVLRPVVSVLRRRWENSKTAPFRSELPQYGQWLLRRLIFAYVRTGLLGSLNEDYRKIYELKGHKAAQQWYYDELIETLPPLILRAKPWVRGIRLVREKWQLVLNQRILRNSNQNQGFVIEFYSRNFGRNRTATAASFSLLLMVTLLAMWFMIRSHQYAPSIELNAGDTDNRNPSGESISFAVPKIDSVDSPSHPPVVQRHDQEVAYQKPSTGRKRVSTQVILLSHAGFTRSGANTSSGVLRIERKPTRFGLPVVHERDAGPYNVELKDTFGIVLARQQVKRVRNKRIDVVFPMQQFPPSEYLITVSIGNELLDNYIFRTVDKR